MPQRSDRGAQWSAQRAVSSAFAEGIVRFVARVDGRICSAGRSQGPTPAVEVVSSVGITVVASSSVGITVVASSVGITVVASVDGSGSDQAPAAGARALVVEGAVAGRSVGGGAAAVPQEQPQPGQDQERTDDAQDQRQPELGHLPADLFVVVGLVGLACDGAVGPRTCL